MIEMAIGARKYGRADRPAPGRHIHIGRAEGQFIDAVWGELADRIDDIDTVIGGAGANRAERLETWTNSGGHSGCRNGGRGNSLKPYALRRSVPPANANNPIRTYSIN